MKNRYLTPTKVKSEGSSGPSGKMSHISSQLYLLQPTHDYDSFCRYIAHLNSLIRHNLPFLKAKFGLATLSMQTVLPDNILLTETIKKKLFDTKIAQTAVLVQYTMTSLDLLEQPFNVIVD
mmetsp:Transcript_45266/g.60098  ORF Transcript_45266/g.60098 Transcript_45266/m.60098 type:complete len:121 (-) Transcript_45266:844-1206(-)